MENNKRASWNSNLGFIMAAIGSAVGLGNIWGFPYKMGRCGGFTFLIVYILLAVFVGLVIMSSELALGRRTGYGVVHAYKVISKKFKWIGWLGIIAPFLIMSFYSVLGGYCFQYMSLNMAELSFGLSHIFGGSISGSTTFGAMLTNPFGCAVFTLFFMVLCMLIVKGGVANGIEKFNKTAMPALFLMLVIVIVRSVSLPHAVEGLKFMFVPGYAVEAGFIDEAPNFISVLGTAGGQMFFSLSLAMGAMITYGSYLDKKEDIVKNSALIVISDTIVALMAGFAVIPAAVANGITQGIPLNEIQLGGPKLLFVTLQDVFSNMGHSGPLFGVVFYALVIIAAISSAISLMEVVGAYFMDQAALKGKQLSRKNVTLWVSFAIMLEALLVAVDGLGSNGVWVPFQKYGIDMWNDCWLDFMDCWSEGLAMPLGAILMALMIGWEIKPQILLDEIHGGREMKGFDFFYKMCIKFIVPVVMAMVLAGQMIDFFPGSPAIYYCISGAVLVIAWIYAAVGNREKAPAAAEQHA
ncbi:MAG: sodium-dependent transporter [Candidatus Limivicinus sp.]|jgi:NSS family neurotransmitter:Na+ symporter